MNFSTFLFVAIVVILIGVLVTTLRWEWLNRNAMRLALKKRDEYWRARIDENYVKRPDPNDSEFEDSDYSPDFSAGMRIERLAIPPEAAAKLQQEFNNVVDRHADEQAQDSTFAMIEHQGTPSPQPAGSPADRWDGTTKKKDTVLGQGKMYFASPVVHDHPDDVIDDFELAESEVAHATNNPDILRALADGYHQERINDMQSTGGFVDSLKWHQLRVEALRKRANLIDAGF